MNRKRASAAQAESKQVIKPCNVFGGGGSMKLATASRPEFNFGQLHKNTFHAFEPERLPSTGQVKIEAQLQILG